MVKSVAKKIILAGKSSYSKINFMIELTYCGYLRRLIQDRLLRDRSSTDDAIASTAYEWQA